MFDSTRRLALALSSHALSHSHSYYPYLHTVAAVPLCTRFSVSPLSSSAPSFLRSGDVPYSRALRALAMYLGLTCLHATCKRHHRNSPPLD
ncbi:hypothetical protein TSAR_011774 [Trichomalopsis sarcophagae]|uniref:Uncharacterized protein n=1 Tax=Trichomalopsis sarcophagae TaxID=543379 RepID=A0A232EG49_9HYME|nr:hypothetical protein TSAR_011774 [Trichomalopsis sarcophagae]